MTFGCGFCGGGGTAVRDGDVGPGEKKAQQSYGDCTRTTHGNLRW